MSVVEFFRHELSIGIFNGYVAATVRIRMLKPPLILYLHESELEPKEGHVPLQHLAVEIKTQDLDHQRKLI